MPATLQSPEVQQTNVRTQEPFPDSEFVNKYNIPVFAEHSTKTRDGRTLQFGYAELKAVADRCNRRIAESGDYAALAIGHNPDSQAKAMGASTPDAVGFVGPFRMGKIQGMGGQQKDAILADLHYFKEDWDRAKKFARRSAELWVEDTYEEMFLDPIALLGAETPRLDLGLVYSRVHQGKPVEKYARAVERYTAVYPGAMNVHVQGCCDDKKDYASGNCGTGEGGFQEGNTCGSSGGSGESGSSGKANEFIKKYPDKPIPEKDVKKFPKRFNRGSQNDALMAAIRVSHESGGKPAYMYSTASGISITTDENTTLPGQEYRAITYIDGVASMSLVKSRGQKLHKYSADENEQWVKYEASTTMLSPEDLGAIVEAIQALPAWQYLEGMMQQGEAEGATPLDTVGDAMPGATPLAGPAGITPPAAPAASPTMPPATPPAPPMAKSPMPPGPTAGPLDAPGGEPGLDAPGGEPGLDAPGGDEPAAEPKPQPPASPDKDKEKNAMAFQSKYAALDAMSDDEFNAYAAQRYGAGAKSYSAEGDGGSTPEGNIDPDGEDADAGSYSEKPPGSDGSKSLNTGGGPTPKKTEHTVTTYQRDADKALHYRLATVEAELAAAKKEKAEEHHKRVDAERQGLLQHYHMCGWLADPDKAFEKLQYAKVQSDEDFHGLLELFVQGSPKIPVGRTIPNVAGAEKVLYDRVREQSGGKSAEQYAKETKAREAVERRANAETKLGGRPDTTGWLAEEMAKLNGSAA